MSVSDTITEASILDDLLRPQQGDLNAEAARAILQLRFSDKAQEHIRQLLDGRNRDDISSEEQSSLEKYLRVGQMIDLLQAKARLSLQNS